MSSIRPLAVTVSGTAMDELVVFCQHQDFSRVLLVADANTYAALGKRLESMLHAADIDPKTIVLSGSEIVADAEHVFDVLLAADDGPRTCIAAGSGTITDICRFVSHRTGQAFISAPTAPSVDGFASIGAPLIVKGVKQTFNCQAPVAIFADVNVLTSAPRPMIAAGFGDMLGKYTSIADWRLGRLLWDEPYDESIARRTLDAVQRCADRVEEIATTSTAGIRILLEALIESGYCMLDFGSSRPASGAEHHYSHFWEMKLMREERPAILHGAKVGVATILVARQYEQIKTLNIKDVRARLATVKQPEPAVEVKRIGVAYGAQAGDVAAAHRAFLDLSTVRYEAIKQRVIASWDTIQKIAADVPPSAEIERMLSTVGGPVDVEALGLAVAEQQLAEENGHYLRERFTVRKLARMLGLDDNREKIQ